MVVTEELDGARRLVFDFKDGGAESASRKMKQNNESDKNHT